MIRLATPEIRTASKIQINVGLILNLCVNELYVFFLFYKRLQAEFCEQLLYRW